MGPIFLIFAGAGLLTILVALPLITNRVPPNGYLGFRMRATLADAGVWYAVNANFGKWLLATGLVVTVLSLLAYFLAGSPSGTWMVILLGVFITIPILGIIHSYRLGRNLDAARQDG